MQQVKRPGDAHHALSVAFPLLTMENQFSLRDDCQLPIPRSAAAEKLKQAILSCRAETPRSARSATVPTFASLIGVIQPDKRHQEVPRGLLQTRPAHLCFLFCPDDRA